MLTGTVWDMFVELFKLSPKDCGICHSYCKLRDLTLLYVIVNFFYSMSESTGAFLYILPLPELVSFPKWPRTQKTYFIPGKRGSSLLPSTIFKRFLAVSLPVSSLNCQFAYNLLSLHFDILRHVSIFLGISKEEGCELVFEFLQCIKLIRRYLCPALWFNVLPDRSKVQKKYVWGRIQDAAGKQEGWKSYPLEVGIFSHF